MVAAVAAAQHSRMWRANKACITISSAHLSQAAKNQAAQDTRRFLLENIGAAAEARGGGGGGSSSKVAFWIYHTGTVFTVQVSYIIPYLKVYC